MSKAITKAQNKSAKRGQGMTEYIIIVALIAIATVGVVTLFGNNIRGLFAMSTEVLAGNAAADMRVQNARGYEKRDIKTFQMGQEAAGGF